MGVFSKSERLRICRMVYDSLYACFLQGDEELAG
jgi:hypothetical protein